MSLMKINFMSCEGYFSLVLLDNVSTPFPTWVHHNILVTYLTTLGSRNPINRISNLKWGWQVLYEPKKHLHFSSLFIQVVSVKMKKNEFFLIFFRWLNNRECKSSNSLCTNSSDLGLHSLFFFIRVGRGVWQIPLFYFFRSSKYPIAESTAPEWTAKDTISSW